MIVTLYNHMNCLPADLGDHVFVFTGRAFDPDGEPEGIITVASCSYRVGEQLVSFRRNMESDSQRFENTLKWAVKCAATFGIENIHAVFELNRPISARYLEKICPDGVVDLRPRAAALCEARAPAANTRPRGQSGAMLPRRRLVFRNHNRTIKSARPFFKS
ncbi:MAG: hypothetical protein WD767_01720 [Alphaproteobacteria bacterium]